MTHFRIRAALRRVMLLLPGLALAAAACGKGPEGGQPPRRAKQKVFVIGFDGMDPGLARRYMDEGKLPNFKRLAEEGVFSTLETTQPSESPVAWASFATGVNPGKHNIYDFLVRDFDTYLPDLAGVDKKTHPPEFLWGWVPIKRPKPLSTRGGTSFWVHAGNDGVRSVVLTVPMTFPPEEVHHGDLLAGLPLPDIRGTIGFFSYWATDLSSFEEGNTEMGGTLKRLLFDGGVAKTLLRGPENPILKQEEAALRAKKKQAGKLGEREEARLEELATGKDVNLPIELRWREGQGSAEIEIQGTKINLRAGEWSDWIPLTFSFNFLAKVHGMIQLLVLDADKELKIYGSPVNFDPRRPPVAISKPDDFSARVARQIGLYRTIGWAEATWPYNEDRIDEATFLEDCRRAFDDRERITFKNLERDDWDLFVAAIETTDRISHMMWRLIDPRHPLYKKDLADRYGDAIEKVYRRADDFVGRLRAKVPKDAVFIVMSDHGFHSFRRGVNLNTWLVQNGYMTFAGQVGEMKGLADLFGRGKFFTGVDWTRTKAYAVGLGQIYFNLKGREGQGIVSTGAEYSALQDDIRSKLVTLVDPETGERVFRDVYRRDDIYKGEYLRNAPDLQVGFNDGYRVNWQDTLGQIQRMVVENNNRKWSGDHCATATEISGGVLFMNRKIGRDKPHIMDLSPTILKLLEVPLPKDLDGQPLL